MPKQLDNKQIQGLQKILSLLEPDALTRKEFTENFSRVLKFLTELKAKNKGEFASLNKSISDLADKIKEDNSNDIVTLKGEANKTYSGLSAELRKIIDDKIASIRDGIDGADADEDRVSIIASERAIEAVKPLIPTNSGLKKQILSMGRLLRKALKKKLKIKDIKDLRKELDELKKLRSQTIMTGSGSGGIGGHVRYHDLSASLDGGVTRTFSLPAFARVLDVKLSSIAVMRQDVDYTINGSDFQITFTAEISDNRLLSGQSCWIIYAQM